EQSVRLRLREGRLQLIPGSAEFELLFQLRFEEPTRLLEELVEEGQHLREDGALLGGLRRSEPPVHDRARGGGFDLERGEHLDRTLRRVHRRAVRQVVVWAPIEDLLDDGFAAVHAMRRRTHAAAAALGIERDHVGHAGLPSTTPAWDRDELPEHLRWRV